MRSNGKGMCLSIVLGTVMAATAWCQQTNPPANSDSQSSKPKSAQSATSPGAGTTAKHDSGNAFPLAQSEAAAKAETQRNAQQNSQPAKPNAAGNTPQSNSGQSAAARDNPFPEGQSEAAAKGGKQSDQPMPSNPSGAGTRSGGYSSSNEHLSPPEIGQGNLPSHEKLDTFTRDHTQDGRIEDDLNAADLYMKNGNYRGALLRYQDALAYDPQNDTALYGVAESMCKQNRTAEAMAHFKNYAKNNPQGQYALRAEKMLAHPNKCMHNF
jgi:tetratricopeptide (TPR) repeat protein